MRSGAAPDERGSASIWVVACCALLMVVAGVATVRGLAVLARHRAESAADLAALAAAGQIGVSGQSCAAAARTARGNGARLRSCTLRLAPDRRSGTVRVAVTSSVRLPLVGVRTVTATARAAREPGGTLPPDVVDSPPRRSRAARETDPRPEMAVACWPRPPPHGRTDHGRTVRRVR